MELFDEPFEEDRRPRDVKKLDSLKLTLDMVTQWIKDTGNHDSRLTFFTGVEFDNEGHLLYKKVLEPLLSMRTTGSVAVERVAKPMKHKVLTSCRNRLGIERAKMLLRVGMNPRFLMEKRKHMKMNLDLSHVE